MSLSSRRRELDAKVAALSRQGDELRGGLARGVRAIERTLELLPWAFSLWAASRLLGQGKGKK